MFLAFLDIENGDDAKMSAEIRLVEQFWLTVQGNTLQLYNKKGLIEI